MNLQDPFLTRLTQWLDKFEPDLWHHLDRVPQLAGSEEIVSQFLMYACASQHYANIKLGREGLRSLPREWTVNCIEELAETALNLEDDWEYRRLLEVYDQLDKKLLQRLVTRGLLSDDPERRETAKEFQD